MSNSARACCGVLCDGLGFEDEDVPGLEGAIDVEVTGLSETGIVIRPVRKLNMLCCSFKV